MCIGHIYTLRSQFGLGLCELNANWMRIEIELEPNSLLIHRPTIKSCTVTPPQIAALSKLLYLGYHTRCIRCPRYEPQWPIMLGCYWLDAAKNETTYQVVLCSSSKFMFHIIYYQRQRKAIIGQTLVCVSIHLECWLDDFDIRFYKLNFNKRPSIFSFFILYRTNWKQERLTSFFVLSSASTE